MKPIKPQQLQRLIDNELDVKQVQQILNEARIAPDHWEQIAVGFVEDQTWSRAFTNQDSSGKFDSSSVSPVDSTAPASTNFYHQEKTDSSVRRTSFSPLVMAASLFLAATIGYMANQIQNRNLPESSLAENVPHAANPLLAANSTENTRPENGTHVERPKMTQADYHLEVPPEHLGELGSAGPVAPIPLFAVNNIEQLRRIDRQRNKPSISPEMLKRFTVSGYQMEQNVNYISGRLGDGRSFVVPVRTIRFLPGQ